MISLRSTISIRRTSASTQKNRSSRERWKWKQPPRPASRVIPSGARDLPQTPWSHSIRANVNFDCGVPYPATAGFGDDTRLITRSSNSIRLVLFDRLRATDLLAALRFAPLLPTVRYLLIFVNLFEDVRDHRTRS